MNASPIALKDKVLDLTGYIHFRSCSRTLSFASPIDIIAASKISEIIPCLERLAAGVAAGYYAAGFISYEAAPAFDPAMQTHAPGSLPLLWFGLYRTVRRGGPAQTRPGQTFKVGGWTPLVSAAVYQDNIRRIRELIVAGDTYQVNYTFPLRADFAGDPWGWFLQLCAAQPANYCAFVDLGRFLLLSASPELFLRLSGDVLETCPMKGTRPRGRWPDEDQKLARALAGSDKDRAENIMIVDLLRNDMSRVSRAGSVRIQSLYNIEDYPTVWQMTSSICSQTNAALPDIVRALFPSGSVTGAPKIRTMEIIRELEPYPRGAYCGAIGWWAPDGHAEFNVAIRTVMIDTQSGQALYNVGGGITYGSSAQDEYEECLTKAALLTRPRPTFELIESLRYATTFFLFNEHMERLAASAKYFGFKWDRQAVADGLAQAVQPDASVVPSASALAPLKVRLRLRQDGSFCVHKEPIVPISSLRVGFAAHPIDSNDIFLYHKTSQRAAYQQALASRSDCDDVLLWNERGEISESTIANVVLEIDRQRWTPPLASGLLAGTYRRHLLEQGAISERVLSKTDVHRASAIYLINSVRQWIKVQWIPRQLAPA